MPGLDVYGVAKLADVLAFLAATGTGAAEPVARPGRTAPLPDLADVVGQAIARRALEVAAAGGHHLLLVGPPGSGKTMLAAAAAGLLPPLVARTRRSRSPRSTRSPGCCPRTRSPRAPPFVAPHHSTSIAALVGGGSRHGPSGRGLVVAPRDALPGRGARVPGRGPRRAAQPLERARSGDRAVRGHRALSGPVPAGARGRTRARARPRTIATACARPSPGAATSGACPGRCSTGSTCAPACIRSPPCPWSAGRTEEHGDGPAPGSWPRVRRRRTGWTAYGWRCNADVPGPALRAALRAAGGGGPAAGRRARPRRADRARLRTGRCGSPGRSRTCRGSPGRPRQRRAGAVLPRPEGGMSGGSPPRAGRRVTGRRRRRSPRAGPGRRRRDGSALRGGAPGAGLPVAGGRAAGARPRGVRRGLGPVAAAAPGPGRRRARPRRRETAARRTTTGPTRTWRPPTLPEHGCSFPKTRPGRAMRWPPACSPAYRRSPRRWPSGCGGRGRPPSWVSGRSPWSGRAPRRATGHPRGGGARRGARRGRRDGGLRSGDRDRRGRPSRLPGRGRRHGRGSRLRRRPRLPGRARHPARADRRHRARGERVPAGQRAGEAPLPGAQPADRGTRRGNGRRRGGALRSGAQRTATDTEALGRVVMAVRPRSPRARRPAAIS